ARAFGLKNAARAELKRALRDLADEGEIEKRRKKLHQAGALPATVLADVTTREAAGLGDRVLLRIEPGPDGPRGRVIRIIDHPKQRVLGIFRATPNGGGRIEPIDKKMLNKALAIPPGASANAQDGDLVAVETSRAPRLGLPTGRVVEKLASLKSER